MSEDISKLLSSLSGDDISSLKQMAKSLFEENPSLKSMISEKIGDEDTKEPEEPGFQLDPGMIMKISKMMSAMSESDKRSDLLLALKPHLSPDRQKRTDEAIQMLKLLKILPSLGELKL